MSPAYQRKVASAAQAAHAMAARTGYRRGWCVAVAAREWGVEARDVARYRRR